MSLAAAAAAGAVPLQHQHLLYRHRRHHLRQLPPATDDHAPLRHWHTICGAAVRVHLIQTAVMDAVTAPLPLCYRTGRSRLISAYFRSGRLPGFHFVGVFIFVLCDRPLPGGLCGYGVCSIFVGEREYRPKFSASGGGLRRRLRRAVGDGCNRQGCAQKKSISLRCGT